MLTFDATDAVALVADEMVDTRRLLHAHPELSFEESATSTVITERLVGIGLTELECPTPTGALFTLDGAREGRTVMLRADIDALPIKETPRYAFNSTVDGVMHACGHDAHTAALLGAASVLARHADELAGRYVFVFQPGEERLGGALAMIEGGLLEQVHADALVGCHVATPLPAGLVGSRPGLGWTESYSLDFHIHGTGGHGALGVDSGNVILAASALARGLAGVVEGLAYDGASCACSAGMIEAGTAPNVLPDSARVRGTLRTYTDEQREDALGRLRALCQGIEADEGVRIELGLPDHTRAVRNDPAVTAQVDEAVRATLGEASLVSPLPPVAPSDDVSELLHRVPGCYFLVGAGLADGSSGMHHSPGFAIDESCLVTAATVLATSAAAMAEAR